MEEGANVAIWHDCGSNCTMSIAYQRLVPKIRGHEKAGFQCLCKSSGSYICREKGLIIESEAMNTTRFKLIGESYNGKAMWHMRKAREMGRYMQQCIGKTNGMVGKIAGDFESHTE